MKCELDENGMLVCEAVVRVGESIGQHGFFRFFGKDEFKVDIEMKSPDGLFGSRLSC